MHQIIITAAAGLALLGVPVVAGQHSLSHGTRVLMASASAQSGYDRVIQQAEEGGGNGGYDRRVIEQAEEGGGNGGYDRRVVEQA